MPAHQLPNDAMVVRGGVVTSEQLQNGCSEHAEAPGIYGFSVQSAPAKTVDELARAGLFPNKQIGVTNVGAVRAAGYNVVPTPGRGFHATVVVPPDWTVNDAAALAKLFKPQPNPAPRK